MANEWRTAVLGDLTINYDGKRKPVKESDRRPGPYPYYGASGIVDYVDGYLFDGDYLLIAEDGENLRTRQTPIAFMARGKSWVNNHAHIVTGNDKADTRFLMYALEGTDISGYLTGAVMPKLTQGNLNKIELNCPPLPEQRAIAHVLGTLDDKIELNRRANETIEAMARALFKAWFVDFEPVRAKMEGRWLRGQSLPGLPALLYDIFPDRLVESELGAIPEGWDKGSFGHIVSQRSERVGRRDITVLSAVASGKLARSDDHFTKRVYSKETDKYLLVEQWDFAYNPSRINIGSIGMLEEDIVGGVSPVYVVARPKTSYQWFLEFSIRRAHTKTWINILASGSVRQSLSYTDFASIPCVVPTEAVVQEFNRRWATLQEGIRSREAESRSLAQHRDTLLPKLISGELRVPDAERIVGATV